MAELDLSTLVQNFEEAEEATQAARDLSDRDVDYYDNKQLSATEIKALRDRGQPDIVINRIAPKIDFLIGLEAQARSDPKGFPRNPGDQESAEAATDALRFVGDNTDLDQKFSGVWEDMLKPGFGGLELGIERKQTGIEISAKKWDFDRLFYDPHSSKHDFSDARYMGGVVWMDAEEAKERWKDKADDIISTITSEQSDNYDDKPSFKIWAKGGHRARIRVVMMYYISGSQWYQAIYTKGAEFQNIKVPFVDEHGDSFCPLFLQAAFIDRENNRYGVIRRLIGAQDEINKRRSKLLHLMSVRQILTEEGAVDDIDDARRQLAKPDGAVTVAPDRRFEIIPTTDMSNGQSILLQEAKNEIEQMGPNASLQGKGDQSQSGRAILANQQGGIVEVSVLTDRHRAFKRRIYRAIWSLIRQYWTEERWIRITDNEGNAKFAGLNRQITRAELLIEKGEAAGHDRQDLLAFMEQQSAQDPQFAAEMRERIVQNPTHELDLDIIIEDAPDTTSIQQEQFEQLAQILPAMAPNDPRLRILIQASQLRNKKELIETLDSAIQQSPEQKEMNALQIEKLKSEVEKTRSEGIKNLAQAEKVDVEATNEQVFPLEGASLQ